MITYNQSDFVSTAINSALEQIGPFELEIIICDDCSTDSTVKEIRQSLSGSSVRSTVICNSHNIGVAENFYQAINACNGKYIALLEGDDCWLDHEKLAKQVKVLEENQRVSACYSLAEDFSIDEGKGRVFGKERPSRFDLKYLLTEGWFIRTASLVFRSSSLPEFPGIYFRTFSTDYVLHCMLAQSGEIVRIDQVMARYNRHSGGVSSLSSQREAVLDRYLEILAFLKDLNSHYHYKFQHEIAKQSRIIKWRLTRHVIRTDIYSMVSRKYVKALAFQV